MRKPIIAGNWKMFKTRDEALAFIYAVNNDMPSIDKVQKMKLYYVYHTQTCSMHY